MNLTTDARDALINAASGRQGAKVPGSSPVDAVQELTCAGLIGVNHGLTRKGTVIRQRILNSLLDRM